MRDLVKKYTTDPSLVIVKTLTDRADRLEHNCAIKQLVHRISLNISPKINYDHVEMSIPKHDLPLKVGKKRHDIVWETPTGNLILVEVTLVKGWKQSGTSK